MKKIVIYAAAAKQKAARNRIGLELRVIAVGGKMDQNPEHFEQLACQMHEKAYPLSEGWYGHALGYPPFVITPEIMAELGYMPREPAEPAPEGQEIAGLQSDQEEGMDD